MWLKGTSVPGIKLRTAMVYTISITTSTPDKRDCSRVTCSNVPVLLVLKITALWLNWRLLCHQILLWNLEILWQSKYFCSLTLIGMRQSGFTPLIIFGLDFVSWIFIKNFQTFLEVKIEINQDNLTPCQAHWVL